MSSKKENMNPLQRLEALGQSVWLDYIRRDLIDSGGRILDVQPTALHQRIGVIIGSKNEVQRVTSYHAQC